MLYKADTMYKQDFSQRKVSEPKKLNYCIPY